jgi:small-conductance mechanosensitive channel
MIVVVTWLATRLLHRLVASLLTPLHLRPSLVELFQKLVTTAIWLGGILAAAIVTFPTLTPAKVLTTIGLGSIAIGFAFKDIFENFFAGVLILLREPFQLGDFIESEGIEGQVEEITIRDTYLRQTDGQRVVLPNAQLFKNPVTVRTDWSRRRVTVICGVAYDEDVDRAREVIYNAVKGLDKVDPSQDIQIFAQAFGASSIDYEVTWWTGSQPVEVRASRDQVVAAVKRGLDEAGIEIPFPYRTLTFKEPLETIRRKTSGCDDHQDASV